MWFHIIESFDLWKKSLMCTCSWIEISNNYPILYEEDWFFRLFEDFSKANISGIIKEKVMKLNIRFTIQGNKVMLKSSFKIKLGEKVAFAKYEKIAAFQLIYFRIVNLYFWCHYVLLSIEIILSPNYKTNFWLERSFYFWNRE
jgi:hypothetical protein